MGTLVIAVANGCAISYVTERTARRGEQTEAARLVFIRARTRAPVGAAVGADCVAPAQVQTEPGALRRRRIARAWLAEILGARRAAGAYATPSIALAHPALAVLRAKGTAESSTGGGW